jgi:CBS domain-containing protein
VPTVSARAPLSQAVEKLYNARVTGVVLVEDGYPVGLFTQAEAVASRELPGDTPVERAAGYSMICLPAGIPLFRAAAFALQTRARRVVAVEGRDLRGIMTGIDFARADGRVAWPQARGAARSPTIPTRCGR